MKYAQLNEDNSYNHQITTGGDVAWDENNYCTAEALVKDGKASQFRVVELHEIDPPSFDTLTQIAVRDGGELVDGQWQYKWRVDDLTPEQIAAYKTQKSAAVRSERNRLLTASDWTQLADSPVYKTAWATYRQELRDISTQDGFPTTVVWPVKP
jgi:hypothetical protein